jgi:hypothetical protein
MLHRLKPDAPEKQEVQIVAQIPVTRPAGSANAAEEPASAQVMSQLEANRVEIESLSKDERHLKGLIAQYENRLNRTPYAEQQQASIIRDTEALRLEYADLQRKEQESQLATNLEKQQGGQQFRLIDPASLPTLPSSPKRLKMSLMAAVLGLLLGGAAALLLELRDTSFHTEKELAKHLSPPLIVGLPVFSIPGEARRRAWITKLEWIAGSILLLAITVAELYVYKRG